MPGQHPHISRMLAGLWRLIRTPTKHSTGGSRQPSALRRAPDCGVVLRPSPRPLHHLGLPRPLPGGHRVKDAVQEVQADLGKARVERTHG